ncbi:MAG: cell division protein FtsW [Candidatus Kapabacteria bacterium]|nr:cell division protein FtsW [Candidatus Kapabacteria bacterium]
MKQKPEPSNIDWFILLPIAALLLFSVAFVYSASASFADVKLGSSEGLVWNHALRVIIGLFLMLIFAKVDYHVFERSTSTLMWVAYGFLVMVLVMGTEIKGASRWVRLGPLNFQPSELAKWTVVLHTAVVLSMNTAVVRTWKGGIWGVLKWTLPVSILIALQPNLSTATVIFLIVMVMMFLGDVRPGHLAIIVASGMVVAGLYAVTAEYRLRRLLAFFGGQGDEAVRYQLDQALIAFGNGGFSGVGPGQSRQRDFFLPESYGDFIFSIVGEEYGFIGIFFLMSAFILIMLRGYTVAKKAPDSFGRILAGGITTTLSIYAFVNAGVTCGILPTTGLPMPFISYGGSAVFFSAIAVGILLNISSQAGVFKRRVTRVE